MSRVNIKIASTFYDAGYDVNNYLCVEYLGVSPPLIE